MGAAATSAAAVAATIKPASRAPASSSGDQNIEAIAHSAASISGSITRPPRSSSLRAPSTSTPQSTKVSAAPTISRSRRKNA